MNKDKISAFTLRIAQSNNTGIIAVLYDIFDEYANEARLALHANMKDDAVSSLKKCSEVVGHLQKDLNFDYKVSRDLYALYDYVQRCLAKSIYQLDSEGLEEAVKVMQELGEAFEAVASKDNSSPAMKNTQKVMAGYTYGRTSLNENIMGDQSSRGFWA